MRGDIVEILGLPLAFWSHPDVLNADFSTGVYAKQFVLLRGMDGHTAWPITPCSSVPASLLIF